MVKALAEHLATITVLRQQAAAAVIQQSPRSIVMGRLRKKPITATAKGTENPRGVGGGGDGASSDTAGENLVL